MTDYFTEHDEILENKLGIADSADLRQAESVIVSARLSELAIHPLAKAFDFEHLKAIHKYLFGDIYPFAGTVRTVDIAKPGSAYPKY